MKVIIPGVEEIIEINKKLGKKVMNRGAVEFLMAKIESKYKSGEYKKQIAKIGAILWMDIIQQHPFIDGNKRTATETLLLFLKKNNYILETPIAGKVYISLKIANNEINYEELTEWVYQKLKKSGK